MSLPMQDLEELRPDEPKRQQKRDREEVKINRVANGYTVKSYPDMFVFNNLEGVFDHLKKHFESKETNERKT